MAASIEQWNKLLCRCLSRRLDANKFRELAKLLTERDPVPGRKLIDAVLDSKTTTNVPWDPLIPVYVDTLRRLGMAKIPDILSSLLDHSSISEKETTKQSAGLNTLLTDYRILQDLLMAVTAGWVPKSVHETRRTFTLITDWIFALLSWNSANANDENPGGALGGSQDAVQVFESIGILLAALVGSGNALDSLSTPNAEGNEPNSRIYPGYRSMSPLSENANSISIS